MTVLQGDKDRCEALTGERKAVVASRLRLHPAMIIADPKGHRERRFGLFSRGVLRRAPQYGNSTRRQRV